MKIESRIGQLEHTSEKIYKFISDFRNFNNFIPEDRVFDWMAEEDSCNFKIDMLGNVRMLITEREPFKLIKVISDPEVGSYNFTLWIQIKELNNYDSRIKITMEPKLNQVMLSMVKNPLKKFLDSLIDEIEGFEFQA